MRVAFVSGDVTAIGSSRMVSIPLAKALQRLGHDVACFDTILGRDNSRVVDGIVVRQISIGRQFIGAPLASLRAFSKLARRKVLKQYNVPMWPTSPETASAYDIAAGRAYHTALADFHPDVIYAFMNINLFRLLSAQRKFPAILAINLIGFGIDPKRGGAIDTFPLQSVIFRDPIWDLHIAASRFELNGYRSVYELLGLNPSKLFHLHHCVDEEMFHPIKDSEDRCLSLPNWKHLLVYPVQVYPRKNIEMAIHCIAKLSDIDSLGLVVTGAIWDKEYLVGLRKEAHACGVADRLLFLGGIPSGQLPMLLRRADLTVFPSHQETFGLGLAESLMCGTPVIGPRWIHPCVEILDDQLGAWLSEKDIDVFAKLVREVLTSDHDRKAIAERASARFSSATVADQFVERVQEIRAARNIYQRRLDAVDWRSLYQDSEDFQLRYRTES